MNPLHLLGLLAVGLATLACQPTGTFAQLDRLQPQIVMQKGPCHGTCPVYTLTVYERGLVAYRGERFSEKQGLHVKRLEKTAYNALVKAFDEANLFRYDNVYQAQIPDLPTVTLRYTDRQGQTKQIIGKDGRPEPVIILENMLEAIANSGGWTAREGKAALAGRVDTGEVIVQLEPQVDARVWIIQYNRQGLAVKEQIAPNQNYWLLTFDPQVVALDDLLGILRADRAVLNAQANRQRIDLRSR